MHTAVRPGLQIVLKRVRIKHVTKHRTINYAIVRHNDPSMYQGNTQW